MIRPDGKPLSAHDVRRLEKYSQSLVDHHLVADLIPPLARAYFAGNVPATMSYAQTAIVLSLGLQFKEMEEVAKGLGLPAQQIMALFNKAVRKMHGALRAGKEREVEAEMPEAAFPTRPARRRIGRGSRRWVRRRPVPFSFSSPFPPRNVPRRVSDWHARRRRETEVMDTSQDFVHQKSSLAGATVYSGYKSARLRDP